MSPGAFSTRQKAVGAWLVVCVVWGTTYLAIRICLETMPPFVMAGMRWTVAGLLFAAGLARTGRPLPRRETWPSIVLTALLLLVLGNGAVVWAEQFVSSGLTAVLIASSPFWMVASEAILGTEPVRGKTLFGLAVGFSGIVLLVWPELTAGGSAGRGFLGGVIALQIACAGWAIGSSRSKRHMVAGDLFTITAAQMLIAGATFLALATALGEWQTLRFSPRSSVALLYLTLVGSIGAYAAYAYALKHLPVALVSLYAYINPIIAVVLGVLLLDEAFGARMGVAAAVVLLGVAIVQRPGSAVERDRRASGRREPSSGKRHEQVASDSGTRRGFDRMGVLSVREEGTPHGTQRRLPEARAAGR